MKKNLITALKKLVTSFGGKAESNNAVDLVDEFADVAAQGGGSGGGSLSIEYFTDAETGVFVCSTPKSEIIAALEAGKSIHAEDGYADYGTTRMYTIDVDGNVFLVFLMVSAEPGKADMLVFGHLDGYVQKYRSAIETEG